MRVNMKHVVEIAGGLVIGGLMADGLKLVVEVTKKQVKKLAKKES